MGDVGYQAGAVMTSGTAHGEALLQMVLNLTRELWIVKDRQLVTERLLAERGIDLATEIERHRPEGEFAEALDAQRRQLLDLVLEPALSSDA